MRCNVWSTTRLARHFYATLLCRKKGALVFTSSQTAFWPCPYSAIYAAGKAFVGELGLSLSMEASLAGAGNKKINTYSASLLSLRDEFISKCWPSILKSDVPEASKLFLPYIIKFHDYKEQNILNLFTFIFIQINNFRIVAMRLQVGH
eukprot:TRINITY_DN4976_c0_g1_i5.p1 TRINITY_DN4976_c0_g1~~TRINITY_DN4976_c0_g1_i5.p1  ORF type:complete len:148 (+),score=22.13 TRINITY_DN4976_c0_g1_i5:193-636(+)